MFVKFSYGCKNIVFELNTMNHAILIFFEGISLNAFTFRTIPQNQAVIKMHYLIFNKQDMNGSFRMLPIFNFYMDNKKESVNFNILGHPLIKSF
jgi:hypothetical protein